MDRLERMDRRARYSVGGALAFLGVLLLVLGWYLVSGEAIAAKQLPYLASASLPGAVLVVCGFVFAVTGSGERDAQAARRIAELHALLTEAVATVGADGRDAPFGSSGRAGVAEVPDTSEAAESAGSSGSADASGLPEAPEPAGPIEPSEPPESSEPSAGS